MLSLLLATLLTQATMTPTSDLSTNRVRSIGSTVSRTLRDRWSEQVNVLDYGAWCDFDTSTGTGHDDTAALRAAFVAGAGKTIRIPASSSGKCCMVSASLVIDTPGTTVTGDGRNSCIVTKPGGWEYGLLLPSTIDYGNIVIYGTSNVLLHNFRLRGAKDTPDTAWTFSPDVIQVTSASNVTIDHMWLENTHYSALWSAGAQADNHDFRFTNNTVEDCGYIAQSDALGHGGGGVVQFNGSHGVFTGNVFRRVGFGISATGDHMVVVGNTFVDFQGDAVFCAGDSSNAEGCVVAGNNFRATPDLTPGGVGIYTPTAIYVSNATPGHAQTNSAHISNNVMNFAITNTTGRARCIGVSGIDATVSNNDCLFDVQIATTTQPANIYRGYVWEASSEWGPTIKSIGNTYWAFSSNSEPNFSAAVGLTGFVVVPNTHKISIMSANNWVKGVPVTSTAFWYARGSPGNNISVQSVNDRVDSGTVAFGNTFISTRGRPFVASYDSEIDYNGLLDSVNYASTVTGSGASFTGWVLAANVSGTNTGDVTIGTSNGLSLSGQILSLGAASATDPGAVTTLAQTFAGGKVFSSGVTLPTVYDSLGSTRLDVPPSDLSLYATPDTKWHRFRIGTAPVAEIGDSTGASVVKTTTVRLGDGASWVWSGPIITSGTGSPESSVTAGVGSLYLRTDGSTGTTLYVKESGTGNTGWIAK